MPAANLLTEPVRQFVDEVTGILIELGRRSSPAGALERDAALEAQAIAAARSPPRWPRGSTRCAASRHSS